MAAPVVALKSWQKVAAQDSSDAGCIPVPAAVGRLLGCSFPHLQRLRKRQRAAAWKAS